MWAENFRATKVLVQDFSQKMATLVCIENTKGFCSNTIVFPIITFIGYFFTVRESESHSHRCPVACLFEQYLK